MTTLPASAEETADDQPQFTMDEAVWAAFYDLPSRRFRAIRDAFIRKDFDVAARDLQVSIGYLSIEANRAIDELYEPITRNIATLEQIRGSIREETVTTSDLDEAFARAHWLMSQHFLTLALKARESAQHRNAGRYLRATAHHLERSVLWSDARISRSLVKALDDTRALASRLETDANPERVYRNRPIVATARVLIDVGEHLNRRVWLPEEVTADQ